MFKRSVILFFAIAVSLLSCSSNQVQTSPSFEPIQESSSSEKEKPAEEILYSDLFPTINEISVRDIKEINYSARDMKVDGNYWPFEIYRFTRDENHISFIYNYAKNIKLHLVENEGVYDFESLSWSKHFNFFNENGEQIFHLSFGSDLRIKVENSVATLKYYHLAFRVDDYYYYMDESEYDLLHPYLDEWIDSTSEFFTSPWFKTTFLYVNNEIVDNDYQLNLSKISGQKFADLKDYDITNFIGIEIIYGYGNGELIHTGDFIYVIDKNTVIFAAEGGDLVRSTRTVFRTEEDIFESLVNQYQNERKESVKITLIGEDDVISFKVNKGDTFSERDLYKQCCFYKQTSHVNEIFIDENHEQKFDSAVFMEDTTLYVSYKEWYYSN